jgi:predicted O-methyltransferase YrrM
MESQAEYWNIDPNAGQVLQALIHAQKPKEILEIGTSNGYSAILMGKIASQYGGKITTIEFFEERAQLATENIANEKLSETITILPGDAMEILPRLVAEKKKYQFIFLDANKEEYVLYFKNAMQMIEPRGIIVADNTISHAKKLTEFFTAVQEEPRAHVLELSIGTGLFVIRVE